VEDARPGRQARLPDNRYSGGQLAGLFRLRTLKFRGEGTALPRAQERMRVTVWVSDRTVVDVCGNSLRSASFLTVVAK